MKKLLLLLLLLLMAMALGVTTYILYFQEKSYAVSKTVDELPKTTVNYTDVIVEEFKEIGELYLYEGEIDFVGKMNSDKVSNLDMVNWFFYKEAEIDVVGSLKAGVDLKDLTIEEDDERITISFSKNEIIKLFVADKEKSSLKNKSGWFSADYDAEEITLFWADIERQGAEKDLTEEQMEEIVGLISEGITNLVETLTSDKEVKTEIK